MRKNGLILSILTMMSVGLCSCNDEPNLENTTPMYSINHGATDLAGMGVRLNADDEFEGFSNNMRVSSLGDFESLESMHAPYFYFDFRAKAEVGQYYAAASGDNMFSKVGDNCAIPINEEYMVFVPVSKIEENGTTVGYNVKYEMRVAGSYGLPDYWSTVATLYRGGEHECVITLSSADCEFYSIGQIEGRTQMRFDKVADRLKVSLVDIPVDDCRTGKVELFLRINESYTLVYVEIKE